MAKNTKTVTQPSIPGLPPGARQINNNVHDDLVWTVRKEGSVVQGRIVSRKNWAKADGSHTTINLTQPCDVWSGDNDDIRTAKPGEIVAVRNTAGMKDMETLDLGTHVYVRWNTKVKSEKTGRTYWDMTICVIDDTAI